jgi:hypothetical protein
MLVTRREIPPAVENETVAANPQHVPFPEDQRLLKYPQKTFLTPQQTYYSFLFSQLPSPFNSFDWKTAGFQKFVRTTLNPYEDGLPYLVTDWAVVPDAWCAITGGEDRWVTLLEIVESNDIDENKARKIANLFWMFDEAEYQMNVVLFYPKTSSTMLVHDLMLLDARARVDLKGRLYPYRDAFNTLKVRIDDAVVAGLAV